MNIPLHKKLSTYIELLNTSSWLTRWIFNIIFSTYIQYLTYQTAWLGMRVTALWWWHTVIPHFVVHKGPDVGSQGCGSGAYRRPEVRGEPLRSVSPKTTMQWMSSSIVNSQSAATVTKSSRVYESNLTENTGKSMIESVKVINWN